VHICSSNKRAQSLSIGDIESIFSTTLLAVTSLCFDAFSGIFFAVSIP
jgi:hypothetical protein